MPADPALMTVPRFSAEFTDALGFGPAGPDFLTGHQRPREPRRPLGVDSAAEALILAAGRGARLGEGAKCLCEVGGRPLIDHQLDALEHAGIRNVNIVVGFEQERVREAVGRRADFIVNERYAETNSLYSFMLARPRVRRDVFVLNCDVLFHPDMVRMLRGRHRNALLFDSQSGTDPEEMKVALRGDRLHEMSKSLPAECTRGENVGVLRLDRRAARHAFGAARRIVSRGGQRDWLASAINRTARKHPFKCVDVAGLPWTEIDFPEDLEWARHRVWPAIAATGRRLAWTPYGPPAAPDGASG